MEDHIQQPWDIDADRRQKENGENLVTCRNQVIIHWLAISGDARPYVDWVLRYDHQPAREVNRLLAFMLHLEPISPVALPFRLVRKKRGGGKGSPTNLAAKERDRLLFENITKIMKESGKGSYESAIAKMAELDGITVGTAKAAYDQKKRS